MVMNRIKDLLEVKGIKPKDLLKDKK